MFFPNIECLCVCFYQLWNLLLWFWQYCVVVFFVFTKREQVVTVLPVYINSFCYSVIFEAFIKYTPKFIVDVWSRSCKRKKSCFFCLFFLDMVFNKVQFIQLVINEYVQLWYQLLIQIILYHGNPNWKLLISWLYMILLIHEYWVISYFAYSGLYVFRLFKQHVTGLQFLWNFMCLFLIHMEIFFCWNGVLTRIGTW